MVYSTGYYSAKELTVFPGRSVVIHDAAAYGLIVVQGWGSVGKMEVETPSLIRYGQMTKDELFVTAAAAQPRRHGDQSQRQRKSGDAEAFRSGQSGRERTHEMKFGVNTFIWTASFDRSQICRCCREIKAHGFDGVEVATVPPGGVRARRHSPGTRARTAWNAPSARC